MFGGSPKLGVAFWRSYKRITVDGGPDTIPPHGNQHCWPVAPPRPSWGGSASTCYARRVLRRSERGNRGCRMVSMEASVPKGICVSGGSLN